MAAAGYAVSRIVCTRQREIDAAYRLAVVIADYLTEHGPTDKDVLRERLCVASVTRFERAIRAAGARMTQHGVERGVVRLQG